MLMFDVSIACSQLTALILIFKVMTVLHWSAMGHHI